jgi:hypothetical protein
MHRAPERRKMEIKKKKIEEKIKRNVKSCSKCGGQSRNSGIPYQKTKGETMKLF